MVKNAAEMKMKTENKKKDVEPVERATSAKFLEDEWERMHADPFIDFSRIRPPAAEMCWPLSQVRAKKALDGKTCFESTVIIILKDFGVFPDSKSSQAMSPPRNADNSFNINDIPDTP